jgi:hypothetical protein
MLRLCIYIYILAILFLRVVICYGIAINLLFDNGFIYLVI